MPTVVRLTALIAGLGLAPPGPKLLCLLIIDCNCDIIRSTDLNLSSSQSLPPRGKPYAAAPLSPQRGAKFQFIGEIMIIFIAGASHTGKTALAQKLLEKYQYPYLSIDHLKMGLIRSGNTELTPLSDDGELTAYLWPIVREMVKTAIENDQNLIVEECYIPVDWQKDFDTEYRKCIRYYCLVMSEGYIRDHFADIIAYANVIENRIYDDSLTMECLLADNAEMLALAQKYNVPYVLIEGRYDICIDL